MGELGEDLPDVEMEPQWSQAAEQCRERWLERSRQGVLSIAHFKEHWRIWVPRVYTHGERYDEERARRVLFSTLEEFMCAGEPLAAMSRLERPPSVCGRVFKVGEPTYSCRECGMDSTCVLCVDCFKMSEHRTHKYKMGTSSGGGCCDCGDPEAWKKAPFCDIHAAGGARNEHGAGMTTSPGLPEDMAERVRTTFEAVLWYAYELLSMEHSPRIPADLCLRDGEESLIAGDTYRDLESYCTVLYNDETHTFEQVINTLTRVIKCNQKLAIEYVTNIDREGRAVVKCSSFQHCSELKADIEKYTSRHGNKPLKVLVVHAHVVAHQLYAVRLLAWLQALLAAHGPELRALFAEVALRAKPQDASIVEGVLLRDTHMWKSARTHWHRLLIAGMLMEYDSKKALARAFTRKYGTVMKDFIRDDHDHSFSVSSLSVQIFTVPTLAHYLIAEEDALFTLLNAFLSECSRKCNRDGRFEFERNTSHGAFKRAQYMLYDLRYLLSAVPEKWTDPLRKGFLQGLSLLLNLLSHMQGMDAVQRQVGQHMEYEPEWESAFNLHIKLAFCVSLAIDWCATDRVVLIKAYRATLKKLHECPCIGPRALPEVREVADHSVACLQYDVASKPVSIHLPLSRFLAGLHLRLGTFGLRFDSPELQVTSRPSPEEIMEPVLRAQALVAQVHSGMWRRNGYALLNQLYFYHNVKCRGEMLDRDIALLQSCASVIESNEFLVHVLNKFGLIAWAHSGYEGGASGVNRLESVAEDDNARQTASLVEELLQLLLVVFGERYVPGVAQVTQRERVRHELIQQLCVRPLAHSELGKALPDDVAHETVLDDVIGEVATFRKPAHGSGRGTYELRPELHDQYNVFFYHYTREDASRSEEAQRARHKAAGQLECCPPPQLPSLAEPFAMLADLVQCDVMLHIMRTVLERGTDLRARSFSEPQLHRVLQLMGYALQEEQSSRYPVLRFAERAAKHRLPELLEQLRTSARVEAHKDLIAWTIAKYREVAGARAAAEATPSENITVALPTAADIARTEKDRRAKLAAERRAAIMAQMAAMQNSFMRENARLFEEASASSDVPTTVIEEETKTISESEVIGPTVALGPARSVPHCPERTYTCILCQEEQRVTRDGPVLVLAAFVQQATVLCRDRQRPQPERPYLTSNLGPAPHTATCGHVMHSDCWQKYFDNVVSKEHRRPYRHRHPASFDVEKQEFLCPLCECLSNTVLPLLPSLGAPPDFLAETPLDFDDWLQAACVATRGKRELCHGIFRCGIDGCNCERVSEPVGDGECDATSCERIAHRPWCPPPLEVVCDSLGAAASATYARLYSKQAPPPLGPRARDMLEHYALATYTRGLGLNQNLEDARVPLLMWKSCAYTLHAVEAVLRDSEKPLLGALSSRQRDCLESLVRAVAAFGSVWRKPGVIAAHAFRLLLHLVEHPHDGPSALDWDPFGLLVPLTMSLPALYGGATIAPPPGGGPLELHALHLVFAAHCVRILATAPNSKLRHDERAMETDDEYINSHDAEYKPVAEILHLLGRGETADARIAWQHVRDASGPFLRCCVLFYRHLTDVPGPSQLSEPNGDTFSCMCCYLGLPEGCAALLGDATLQPLLKRWSSHPEVRAAAASLESQPLEPLPVNRLVELPADYSELINAVSLFTCPNSEREDSRNPTMCLACGEMLCSQSYCCQTELNKQMVGACTYHAQRCGAGVGVFLRVRECEILFLASPVRGCFVSPPYLDAYGETDQGLRRGNPLHLCPERYRRLQSLWLGHAIHEEIARAIESSSNLMSTQWQHL